MNQLETQRILDTINDRTITYEDLELTSRDITPRVVETTDCHTPFQFSTQNGGSISLTHSATTQFLNRLQVPIIFFKKCSSDLQQRILDEHNATRRDFLIRNIKNTNDYYCRAVLSGNFSRDKDDAHIFPPALEALNRYDTSLRHYGFDPNLTQLITDFNDCRIEDGGNVMTASLTILNSETGHSSVWIYPTITINNFQYANRRGDISNNLHRIIHRGILKPEEFQQIINDTKNIAQVGLVQYMRAQTETVTSEHARDFLETIDEFPKRFASILDDEWKTEQFIIKTNVMNRIIQLAQELPLFQKVAVTRQVGRFIKLFENTDRERAEIVESIDE